MSTLFDTPRDLSKELNCSWGDKEYLHLLKKDLSISENLTMAMEHFPILKKLVKKHSFSSQEIERCKKESNQFVFSESDDTWQLKSFFRYWLQRLY